MKLAIVLGTRPEIVKMAPVIRACEAQGEEFFILHTGQHYSPSMDHVFFENLDLPKPRYNLESGGNEYRKQIGIMVRDIQGILEKERPTWVLVQGDTNSVLAGALAGIKAHVSVAHHEAGLRSHDLTMPEEKNRIITDHVSDRLFAPTQDALKNLKDEGIDERKILYTGNTIVDAVTQNLAIAKERSTILSDLKLGRFFLATAHRAENVDDPERLRGIMEGLGQIAHAHPEHTIVFSLHPRTKQRLEQFEAPHPQGVTFIDPVGFLDFLMLESNAELIITDSGGIQEEASILHVPCVTVRDNTERPETIEAKVNALAGTDPDRILACAKEMLAAEHAWPDLYGDGKAGERIVQALR